MYIDFRLYLGLLFVCVPSNCFPDQGKWTFKADNVSIYYMAVQKSLYGGSTASVTISCEPSRPGEAVTLQVGWTLYRSPCFQEFLDVDLLSQEQLGGLGMGAKLFETAQVYSQSAEETHQCLHLIDLGVLQRPTPRTAAPKAAGANATKKLPAETTALPHTTVAPHAALATVNEDGIYMLLLHVRSALYANFSVQVDVAVRGSHGYLSAVDWPFLPFYGVMCGVYVLYAVVWLAVSALQWRDLLRIQFWIGGVIFLGMLEKAVFYAEYQSINATGRSVQGAVLFAEVLSCLKRSLARLLVVVVSLGFGIVKPRLGPMLHRVLGLGGAYFVMASLEGCLRTLKPKTTPDRLLTVLGIGLALLDSAICWWIFSSLSQTTRTLRLRRNVIKLSLYRHFTNTLVFAVLASVVFMVWVTFDHRTVECLTDWKELWFDEGYWHLLFSLVLLVIMFLWRPTNNNKRYAFTPLLDAADDELDEEELQQQPHDAFEGMKMRTTKQASGQPAPSKEDPEDDLKWVEETIPSSLGETALPSLLDSDEEIMTVRFERNKME
uniref:Putative lung seven transmembrane receptor n=1 Tax=Amblyomma parvum TaxID=251391 RepID=A0A023G017_AMBPA